MQVFELNKLVPMVDIVLYSTSCPKCEVLKKKLNQAGISYTINDNVEEMLSIGIEEVPVLCVSGELMDFPIAVEWINSQTPRR